MEKYHTIDCYGLLCPMPIIKIARMIKKIKKGEVLELISTDEGVKEDAPSWCRTTGNEFLGIKEEQGIFKVYIKKNKD